MPNCHWWDGFKFVEVDVQISTTDASRVYFDDNFSGARMGLRHFLDFDITFSASNLPNS